jgi:hypothetical protein
MYEISHTERYPVRHSAGAISDKPYMKVLALILETETDPFVVRETEKRRTASVKFTSCVGSDDIQSAIRSVGITDKVIARFLFPGFSILSTSDVFGEHCVLLTTLG